MGEFRDRSPGFDARRVGLVCAICVGFMALFALRFGLGQSRAMTAVAYGIPVLVLVYGALIPYLRWGRSDVVVDATGVRFGARGRALPTKYRGPGDATAYPLFVPWTAVHEASLVGPDQTDRLVDSARTGVSRGGQVSRAWGYFPSPAATHHLLLGIDPAAVAYPPDVTGLGMGFVNLAPSPIWVLPVRDVDGLRRAFADAPVVLEERPGPSGLLP